MNLKNISLVLALCTLPFALIGYVAAGLGGAKLGVAILLIFAATLWIIGYSLQKIESE